MARLAICVVRVVVAVGTGDSGAVVATSCRGARSVALRSNQFSLARFGSKVVD